jgi:hypothetical protein
VIAFGTHRHAIEQPLIKLRDALPITRNQIGMSVSNRASQAVISGRRHRRGKFKNS